MKAITSRRAQRSLLGAAVCASALAVVVPAARAQQVTISIGGYAPTAAPAPPSGQAPPPPGSPGSPPYGRAGIAQAVAYAQYLQYLQALNYAALRGGSASDVAQYFTNGASATTVPSAGQPGGAYFANGAEATVLKPLAPPSASPPASFNPPPPAPPQPSAYPWPFVQAPPQGPPVVRATPPEATSLVAADAALPSTTVEIVEAQPVTLATPAAPVAAMSFEAWLASMGISPEPDQEGTEQPSSVTSVTEPPMLASGLIQRASFAPREKTRKHFVDAGGSEGIVAAIGGAFALGLVLGGLAMIRVRAARQAAPASSVPPPQS